MPLTLSGVSWNLNTISADDIIIPSSTNTNERTVRIQTRTTLAPGDCVIELTVRDVNGYVNQTRFLVTVYSNIYEI